MDAVKLKNFSTLTWCYLGFAILLAILVAGPGMNNAGNIGIIGRTFTFIFASIFGFTGALIGDYLRKVARPDFMLSSGFADTLKQKLFWSIGPQTIGAIAGAVLAGGIIRAIAS